MKKYTPSVKLQKNIKQFQDLCDRTHTYSLVTVGRTKGKPEYMDCFVRSNDGHTLVLSPVKNKTISVDTFSLTIKNFGEFKVENFLPKSVAADYKDLGTKEEIIYCQGDYID